MNNEERMNIPGGSPWENLVGYSRAVRVGQLIEVSGTTAVEDGKVVGKNDVYAQCICIFSIIKTALNMAGATMNDVVRIRAFITDISRWEEFGKAHREVFGEVKPAATLVEVTRLIAPELLIEIEATASITRL